MSADRRVVITGLGAWTAHGVGFDACWEGLVSGQHAFTQLGTPSVQAGLIPDLKPFRAAFPAAAPPLPIPITRLTMVAAASALDDARFTDSLARKRCGVMLNRNRGPAQVVSKIMTPVFAKGPKKTSPLLFSQSVSNAPLGAVATALTLRGPHLLTMGGGAWLTAFDAIRCGDARAILVGGFDEVEENLMTADLANGVIGASVGEGPIASEAAVCVLLEDESAARERRATPLARLAAVERSGGVRAGGNDPLALWGDPDPASFETIARAAIAHAQLRPQDVDVYLGSFNDASQHADVEARLLEALGRADLQRGTLKRVLGETMGAATSLNMACASAMLAKRHSPNALFGGKSGVTPLTGPNVLMTHIDEHANQLAAVLTEAS